MILKNKLKLWLMAIIPSLALIAYFSFNMEFVQKKVFDIKADLSGSERTISFYSQIDATKVASFSDKEMRFEYTDGSVSVWLGSKNKKVHSNMNYIIEDN